MLLERGKGTQLKGAYKKERLQIWLGQLQSSVYNLSVYEIDLLSTSLFNFLKSLFCWCNQKKITVYSRFLPFPGIKCGFHGNAQAMVGHSVIDLQYHLSDHLGLVIGTWRSIVNHPARSFRLPLPPRWELGETLWPQGLGTLHSLCLPTSLGFYPGKGTGLLEFPVSPQTDLGFSSSLLTPNLWEAQFDGQSTVVWKPPAPKLSSGLLQRSYSLQPRECQVSGLRLSLNKHSSKFIACAQLPFLAPWRPWLCESRALNWLLFAQLSALSYLPWGHVCREMPRWLDRDGQEEEGNAEGAEIS